MTRRGALGLALGLALAACGPRPDHPLELALYADGLDSLRSVLTKSGVAIDPAISLDGRGSLRIDATGERTVVRIAEVPIDAPGLAHLSYRARLRSENVAGRAYLEMWVIVAGKGEFFSRALHSVVSGTTEWSTHEAPFVLEPGQTARLAKLNVVVEGGGTVWVDGVTLSAARR